MHLFYEPSLQHKANQSGSAKETVSPNIGKNIKMLVCFICMGTQVTCGEGTKTFNYVVSWKMKKAYICTSAIPMVINFGRVVTYGQKAPHTKLRCLLITWSCDKCKTLYLHFSSTYDHKTAQSGNLQWGKYNFKVMSPFDFVVTWQMKKTYISTSTASMATKFGRVVTYSWKIPLTKWCDLLITRSRDK